MLWWWWLLMIENSRENLVVLVDKHDIRTYIYVLTNVYRSTFPVMHYTNTCMFSFCSLGLERSLSTVAELAFISQLVDWFKVSGRNKVLVFLTIGSAEIFCWMGILSGLMYWHVLEESLWCLTALGLFCNTRWRQIKYNTREGQISLYVLGTYILYMAAFDIPMYINRPNSIKKKLLICEHISTDSTIWTQSLIWMTGYFIIGSKLMLGISV